MNKNSKIYIAGHQGLVGSALVRALTKQGFNNLLTRSHQALDLKNQNQVNNFFRRCRPDYVFLAAAKVGGILANQTYPAEFIYDNLAIELNVIQAAYQNKVKKLLFLGSSCIYPRDAKQPIKEEYLLSAPLEKTNEAYAIAKIAGLKMCEFYNQQYNTSYITAMPTNLYGPHDNFNLNNAHVLPALIHKFQEAKTKNQATVILWGSGQPRRDFLYIDDLASALIFLLDKYDGRRGPVNIGNGRDLSIKELAEKIKKLTGFTGKITWDKTKPDGTPRKLLAINRLKTLGWRPQISLTHGLKITYDWFLKNEQKIKK
ncbi:MAG: GDP-L-fucose synthase [Patescibacteria group bacterium]